MLYNLFSISSLSPLIDGYPVKAISLLNGFYCILGPAHPKIIVKVLRQPDGCRSMLQLPSAATILTLWNLNSSGLPNFRLDHIKIRQK